MSCLVGFIRVVTEINSPGGASEAPDLYPSCINQTAMGRSTICSLVIFMRFPLGELVDSGVTHCGGFGSPHRCSFQMRESN